MAELLPLIEMPECPSSTPLASSELGSGAHCSVRAVVHTVLGEASFSGMRRFGKRSRTVWRAATGSQASQDISEDVVHLLGQAGSVSAHRLPH